MAPEPLILPSEAAELLQVSIETLRRWADAKKIRHVRLPSGQTRYFRSDIEAVLHPVEPTEPSAVGE